MTKRKSRIASIPLCAAIAAASCGASTASGQTIDPVMLQKFLRADIIETVRDYRTYTTRDRAVIPFSQAEIFFEFNSTDEDLGIHFALDGAPWTRIVILDPHFRGFMDARAKGNERENGVTGLFSESAEPGFDEVPMDEFLAKFPEGDYLMLGWTTEGDLLVSQATLTHNLPAGPELVSPEEDEAVDFDEPLEIEWEGVADPKPPASVIIAYQVIVTKEEPGERKREVIIDLGPEARSATVPAEFFEPDKQYKYEILSRETSGNQTISERPFRTEPDDGK